MKTNIRKIAETKLQLKKTSISHLNLNDKQLMAIVGGALPTTVKDPTGVDVSNNKNNDCTGTIPTLQPAII